jgi:hypothetical protein
VQVVAVLLVLPVLAAGAAAAEQLASAVQLLLVEVGCMGPPGVVLLAVGSRHLQQGSPLTMDMQQRQQLQGQSQHNLELVHVTCSGHYHNV